MARLYHTQRNFEKYRPHQSLWKRLGLLFKRKTAYTPYNANGRHVPKKSGTWVGIKLAMIFIVFAAIGVFLARYQGINIEQVTYYGLDNIPRADIDSYIHENFLDKQFLCFNPKNYLLVDTGAMEKSLKNKYSLKSIKVSKNFPHQLIVDLVENPGVMIYDDGEKYFLMDSHGTAVKYLSDVTASEYKYEPAKSVSSTAVLGVKIASSTPQNNASTTMELVHVPDFMDFSKNFLNYPILYDERNLKVAEKQNNILSSDFISEVIDFTNMLEKEGIEHVRYLAMENPGAGVEAYTGSFAVYFQPSNNLSDQINNLKIILKKDNPKKYIDLRYGDRVFWQ